MGYWECAVGRGNNHISSGPPLKNISSYSWQLLTSYLPVRTNPGFHFKIRSLWLILKAGMRLPNKIIPIQNAISKDSALGSRGLMERDSPKNGKVKGGVRETIGENSISSYVERVGWNSYHQALGYSPRIRIMQSCIPGVMRVCGR
jgi:hypothetical protein